MSIYSFCVQLSRPSGGSVSPRRVHRGDAERDVQQLAHHGVPGQVQGPRSLQLGAERRLGLRRGHLPHREPAVQVRIHPETGLRPQPLDSPVQVRRGGVINKCFLVGAF